MTRLEPGTRCRVRADADLPWHAREFAGADVTIVEVLPRTHRGQMVFGRIGRAVYNLPMEWLE